MGASYPACDTLKLSRAISPSPDNFGQNEPVFLVQLRLGQMYFSQSSREQTKILVCCIKGTKQIHLLDGLPAYSHNHVHPD